jgi:hypothetical protein
MALSINTVENNLFFATHYIYLSLGLLKDRKSYNYKVKEQGISSLITK